MSAEAPQETIEAYRGAAPFAFVSYARADVARVHAELYWLQSEGFNAYFDAGIAPGHTWHDELAEAIERCSVFLLFVTPRSVASQNCQRELHFALDLNKPIIAIHLEPTVLPSGIRLAIGDKQAILSHELDPLTYQRRLSEALRAYLPAGERPVEVQRSAAPAPVPSRNRTRRRRLSYAAVAVLVIATVYLGLAQWQRQDRVDTARARLADAQALVQQDRNGDAYLIARELEPIIGAEPEFIALWKEITLPIEPRIAETGAVVSFRPYDVPDAPWTELGTTPIAPVAAPLGVLLLRVEKAGFRSGEFAVANPGPMLGNSRFKIPAPQIELAPAGFAEDMVRVPAMDVPIFVQGFTRDVVGDAQYAIPAFAVSRSEVSNLEYKAFVDAGGYASLEYWRGMKLPDGTALSRDVIASFVDLTGRPGPANWELGTYPTGAAHLPVGGLSWFEAAAYASYRGLALPTLHHWARMALAPAEGFAQTAPAISRASHFDATGPVSVDSDTGIGPWGSVHTAGNVREWIWNRAGDKALAMGGAWSDYPGVYQDAYTLDPLDRSAQNGVRLMHTLGEPIDPALLADVVIDQDPALVERKPLNEDAFAGMRFQFTHARREPASVTQEVVERNDTWVAEEVRLAFDQNQVFTVYLVKPIAATGKVQPVLYMPHGGARARVPNRFMLTHVSYLDFVVRAGRALVIPIWAGTAQRYVRTPEDPAAAADTLRRAALAWHEDAATTIDYLETRQDVDASRVGFLGNSFGAIFGPIPLAIERRFSAAVLIAGGTWNVTPLHPMADSIHYAPRVTIPVLMINGRYDHLFLYERSQKRLFDLLGSAPTEKEHIIFDTGHFDFPRNQVARRVTDWFDRYLGPVRPQ